jgi:hypothetical protein
VSRILVLRLSDGRDVALAIPGAMSSGRPGRFAFVPQRLIEARS